MNTLLIILVMVTVFNTVRWVGSIWIAGAEAHDHTE